MLIVKKESSAPKLEIRNGILRKVDVLQKKMPQTDLKETYEKVGKIFDKNVSTHYKSEFADGMDIIDTRVLIDNRQFKSEMQEIIESVLKFLRSEGYRTPFGIDTPQEGALGGDVPNIGWKAFMPIGMQHKIENCAENVRRELTRDEADKGRRLRGYTYAPLTRKFERTNSWSDKYYLGALFKGSTEGLVAHLNGFGHNVSDFSTELKMGSRTSYGFKIGHDSYEVKERKDGILELHCFYVSFKITLEPLKGEETARDPRIVHPLLTDEKLDEIFRENPFEKALDIVTVEARKAQPPFWEQRILP